MRSSALCLLLFLLVGLAFLLVRSDHGRPTDQTRPDHQLRSREKREVDTYYDFLINEWSFKFWAVFQLVTIAVLLYSTFAAIYYAKYTYLHTPPTEDDLFLRKRSLDAAIDRWGRSRVPEYRPSPRNK